MERNSYAHSGGKRAEVSNVSFEKPTQYVFSFYARSDSDKGRIGSAMQGGKKERAGFNLTKEWQRYHTVIELQPAARGSHVFYISTSGDVWIDALQVEKGTEPTEYTP